MTSMFSPAAQPGPRRNGAPRPPAAGDMRAIFSGAPRAASQPAPGGDTQQQRLATLGPARMAASLAWLAGYDPATFDAVLDASEPCAGDGEPEAEPYCTLCSAPVGIFLAYGNDWQHYQGDATPGNARPYDPGHIPAVGWRPATDIRRD